MSHSNEDYEVISRPDNYGNDNDDYKSGSLKPKDNYRNNSRETTPNRQNYQSKYNKPPSGIHGYDDDETDGYTTNETTGGPDTAIWAETSFLEMYQEMRGLEKDHGVRIAVPEFLFFGFQSAGKTSTLSVVSGIPAGTMKDGTGTRCPVRYSMVNNPDLKSDRITVQGSGVRDYEEQVQRVCDHMKELDAQNRFSAEIYEVHIESPKVPNMIFVDMPGMLRNDKNEKFAEWKKQLEMITCELLGSISADGVSHSFIPVFVKASHEKEEEDLVHYIDGLLKKVRPRWKDEALFIVNKFDRLGNMDKAGEICVNLDFLSQHGETCFTITNPTGAATARMTSKELMEHIKDVPNKEDDWWDKLLYELQRSHDPDCENLRVMREDFCGTRLMKNILKRKMIEIVRLTLPYMQQQLDQAEMEKKDRISQLQQELQLGDPSKLKELVQRFNVRYLAMMKEFYGSRKHGTLEGIRRSWKGEMQDFHQIKHFQSRHAQGFEQQGYYIKPRELRKLFRKVQREDLAAQVDMKLTATSSLKRALDFWIAMISFMNFPEYNDTDILNMSVSFDGTIQSDPWETARNIVFHASTHLRRGCIWLAEYFRYRLKCNADIIFKSAIREFEETGHYEKNDLIRMRPNQMNDDEKDSIDKKLKWAKDRTKTDEKMIRLLKIGRIDYDKVVDHLINEFIDTIETIPSDQTECLDKQFCGSAMNYSTALQKLWDHAVGYKMSHEQRLKFNYEGISGAQDPNKKHKHKHKHNKNQNNNYGQSPQQSPQQSYQQPPQQQSYQQSPKSKPPEYEPSQSEISGVPDYNGQGGSGQQQGGQYGGQGQQGGQYVGQDDGLLESKVARANSNRDTFFYKTLYPFNTKFNFPMHHETDIDLIYNLARVQWAAVKHHIITSVQQQLGHRIMKEITFEGNVQLFSNAMLRGWDRPQIQALINDLTKKTNMSTRVFEEIIAKAPIPAQKAVMQMSDTELLDIYGAELKEKQKELQKMVAEYKDFLQKKDVAERKIDEIKSIEFDIENYARGY